jgi:hypothetical protein
VASGGSGRAMVTVTGAGALACEVLRGRFHLIYTASHASEPHLCLTCIGFVRGAARSIADIGASWSETDSTG